MILCKSPEDGAFLATKGRTGASGACQGRVDDFKFRHNTRVWRVFLLRLSGCRMSESLKSEPKTAVQQAREQRLRRALRENLKRRKAQVRGREKLEAAEKAEKQPAGDSGG
jgi:hypothetical protein